MSAPITTKKTTKLTIPHNIEHGVDIVGVLEQLEPERETRGRKIALVSSKASYTTKKMLNMVYVGSAWYNGVSFWPFSIECLRRHIGIDEERSA